MIAPARAEVFLTLDRADFVAMIGGTFYGLSIVPPATALHAQREAGRLRGPPR